MIRARGGRSIREGGGKGDLGVVRGGRGGGGREVQVGRVAQQSEAGHTCRRRRSPPTCHNTPPPPPTHPVGHPPSAPLSPFPLTPSSSPQHSASSFFKFSKPRFSRKAHHKLIIVTVLIFQVVRVPTDAPNSPSLPALSPAPAPDTPCSTGSPARKQEALTSRNQHECLSFYMFKSSSEFSEDNEYKVMKK